MLFHWYELDPESAVPETITSARHRPHRAALQYDAAAAMHRARGGSVRTDLADFKFTAANDRQRDAHAARLRETGLGVTGYSGRVSKSSINRTVRQMVRQYWCAFYEISSTMLGALHFVTQAHGRNDSGCSHTIVSNGADDPACAPDGAQRQRFR